MKSVQYEYTYSVQYYEIHIDCVCYDTNRVEALLHLDPISVLLLENTLLILAVL